LQQPQQPQQHAVFERRGRFDWMVRRHWSIEREALRTASQLTAATADGRSATTTAD